MTEWRYRRRERGKDAKEIKKKNKGSEGYDKVRNE
jgi:hypothetical protein